MDIIFLDINWLVAIPLGFTSLLSVVLALRGARFFDHASNASQKERSRDIFLSIFDICTLAFCLLLALSPTELWLAMIPIGLGMFVLVTPISILGSYYHLYVVTGFMPKNAGVKINALNEKSTEKISWYEFFPIAFMLGWLVFFVIKVVAFFIG